jgi:hypothetical protein
MTIHDEQDVGVVDTNDHVDGGGSDAGQSFLDVARTAALVGDHDIIASWAAYVPDGPSWWTIVGVTDDGRLVRLQTEFAAAQYGRDAEQQHQRMRQNVEVVVHEASSHRLSDALSLHVGKVSQRIEAFDKPSRDQLDVGDVCLRFSTGEVDLGVDQSSIHDTDDRARSDAFLAAVRTHTGL